MSEKKNKQRRERRAKNGEEVRAKDRDRYERDKERLKARQKRYYHSDSPEERKRYYRENRELFLERQKEYHARDTKQVHDFLGAKCVCCGEKEREFLTIDHVNNDGKREKKNKGGSRSRVYVAEIRRAFLSKDIGRISKVKKRFQLLCQNCNYSKYRGKGVCVHRRGDVTKHPDYPYASVGRCG